MRWLLLVMVFDISNGGMQLVFRAEKVFASESACDAEGNRLVAEIDYPSEDLRSMSMCLPEDAFDQR